ncbi:MAG: hypothetical protein WC248_06335, partial [Candidatus Methanomethylophilaceae archaeon]
MNDLKIGDLVDITFLDRYKHGEIIGFETDCDGNHLVKVKTKACVVVVYDEDVIKTGEEDFMTIKFSSDYPKLHGQTSAELLAVKPIRIDKDTPKELIEYDTRKSDGTYYNLKTDNYIQLIFLGNLGIPFCTIRSKRNRYAEDKEAYYLQFVGENFT